MAGKQVRTRGLFHEEAPTLSWRNWQKNMCNGWLSTNNHFVEKIVKQRISLPDHLTDTLTLRVISVFSRFGVAQVPLKCFCGSAIKLECRNFSGCARYQWTCSTVGHKHMEEAVNSSGFLQQVPINSWMPFLHTIHYSPPAWLEL